jgi:hypothetical protein
MHLIKIQKAFKKSNYLLEIRILSLRPFHTPFHQSQNSSWNFQQITLKSPHNNESTNTLTQLFCIDT